MKKIFRALAHLKQFIRHPLPFMESIHTQHNDFLSLTLGKRCIHFVSHPQYAEAILGTNPEHYQKSKLIFDKITPITGKKGLVQLTHQEWEEMRKHTNELFQKHYLEHFVPIINIYADELIAKIKNTSSIDIQSLIIDYTMNTAMRMLFGITPQKNITSISNSFIELNYLCGKKLRSFLPIPFFIPTLTHTKIFVLRRKLLLSFKRLIEQANQAESKQLHLLDILKKAYPQKKHQPLILDQLMTFLFAGFETTAASLSFCFFLLAKHPQIQTNILNESKSINLQKIDSIKQARYTAACYREALRLYPPAWILAREATQDTFLSSRRIKRKDVVIIAVHEIQRHKNFWLNANEFMPERFLEHKNSHKFSFIPFGYGKRICSGMQLAMLEATILLSKICSAFEIHATEDPLSLEAMITLHAKKEVRIHATQRI